MESLDCNDFRILHEAGQNDQHRGMQASNNHHPAPTGEQYELTNTRRTGN